MAMVRQTCRLTLGRRRIRRSRVPYHRRVLPFFVEPAAHRAGRLRQRDRKQLLTAKYLLNVLKSPVSGSELSMKDYSVENGTEMFTTIQRVDGGVTHTPPVELGPQGGRWSGPPNTVAVAHMHWDPTAAPTFSNTDI